VNERVLWEGHNSLKIYEDILCSASSLTQITIGINRLNAHLLDQSLNIFSVRMMTIPV